VGRSYLQSDLTGNDRAVRVEKITDFFPPRISSHTANKELRSLRAAFNFGKKKRWLSSNPAEGLDFLPVEKNVKYVPSSEDINRVIAAADSDTQDYLWVIRDTMARMSEVTRLTWDDVSFEDRYLILYTRKKKGGHLTPRKIPLTDRLFWILSRRYLARDPSKPWIFWHAYWSSKTGQYMEGPYKDRKRIMRTLCRNAGVRYFRYHALRHSGASEMERSNVPIGTIQRILGHENRTTTEVYIHSFGEAEKEAIASLERACRKSHTESHTK
jgi:integrase